MIVTKNIQVINFLYNQTMKLNLLISMILEPKKLNLLISMVLEHLMMKNQVVMRVGIENVFIINKKVNNINK